MICMWLPALMPWQEFPSSQGKYAQAELLYRQALEIKKQVLGPNHPSVVRTVESLAAVEAEAGNYSEAEQLYQQAIRSETEFFGPSHPGVAVPVDDLAALEMEEGKYASAETLYEKALRIREQIHGPDHPRVANLLKTSPGYTWRRALWPSRPLLRRALAIRERALGANQREVAETLSSLALVYAYEGNYARQKPPPGKPLPSARSCCHRKTRPSPKA